ncbi:MAG TPA: FAD:protein FMN transferase, partial [Ghiorsea sp.]|nr:FAD:protein FMN transferase [Ghiorsea sp.]
QDVKESRFLLGTLVEFTIFTDDEDQALATITLAAEEMQRVQDVFTTFGSVPNSVKLFNQAPANTWIQLDKEVETLLLQALTIQQDSQGAFDPTLGKLNQLWAFSGESPPNKPPTLAAIQDALAQTGIESLQYSEHKGWMKKINGLMLDFGAIAKGYAIDRGIQVLKQYGVQHAIINAGGDMRILGDHGGKPWRIAIRHPRSEKPLGWVEIENDTSIVTSGDYERFYLYEGKRYHHILDPKIGLPSHASQSVTVIAPSAVIADAWSTALFVLGANAGLNIAQKRMGIEVLWMTNNGEDVKSSGFELHHHAE